MRNIMPSSSYEKLPNIPDPSDPGNSGTQQDNQVILTVPEGSSGGIVVSPLSRAFDDLIENSPQKLGSMPSLVVGIINETMLEKKRLDVKLQERESQISNQFREIATLKEINAELRTALNAESRVKLLRSASITGGMLVLGLGFKLIEKAETLPYGIGLMLLGVAIAAFGWMSRAAKEIN